jgi:hypothetical protein
LGHEVDLYETTACGKRGYIGNENIYENQFEYVQKGQFESHRPDYTIQSHCITEKITKQEYRQAPKDRKEKQLGRDMNRSPGEASMEKIDGSQGEDKEYD